MDDVILPIVVFSIVYIAISFDLVHKAMAALLGVAILIIFKYINIPNAAKLIDFEIICLLLGMMIIVAVLEKSGFLMILSAKIVKFTGGSPLKILVLFTLFAGMASSLLNNVSTVLIIVPVVVEITKSLGLDPKIYVIAVSIASNIGGILTLVMIIAAKAGIPLKNYIVSLSMPVLVCFCMTIIYLWFVNRENFEPININLAKLFIKKINLDIANAQFNYIFLIECLASLVLSVFFFITQPAPQLTPGLVAITIAIILVIITKSNVDEIMKEIDWSTILFFGGLFILVGVLEKRGIINWIANNVFLKIGHNPYIISLLVLWICGLASGFVDNTVFTITMIPIIKIMLEYTPSVNGNLWVALALGVCFGGNLTLIGSSANVVASSISKKFGYEISFYEFFKYGFPLTIISLLICSAILSLYLSF